METKAKCTDTKIPESQKARFESERKKYERMAKDISPYLKKRVVKTYSTSGEWIVSQEQK